MTLIEFITRDELNSIKTIGEPVGVFAFKDEKKWLTIENMHYQAKPIIHQHETLKDAIEHIKEVEHGIR